MNEFIECHWNYVYMPFHVYTYTVIISLFSVTRSKFTKNITLIMYYNYSDLVFKLPLSIGKSKKGKGFMTFKKNEVSQRHYGLN